MLDPIERTKKIKKLNLQANKIIREKGLCFTDFMGSTTCYEYNNWVAHKINYKKLLPNEYLIFKCLIKQEWGYLEVLWNH